MNAPLTDWSRRFGLDDIEQFLDPTPPPPPTATRRSVPYIGPERPGDAFNARHTGSDILASLGFRLKRRERSGDEYYVRPGKELRETHSATVYSDDGHTTIWSDTCVAMWPALTTRRPYDPYGLYAATSHAGDFTAARKELERQGYGASWQPDDLSWAQVDPPLTDHDQGQGQGQGDDTGEAEADAPWPEPEPLDPEIPAGPPFPVGALPEWMGAMASELAEALLVPTDLPAMAILGALSSVTMTKVKIAVAGTSWQEDTNLYLMCGYPSGGGKSPAFGAAMAPVNAFEAQRMAEVQPAIEEAETRLAILAKREKTVADSAALGNKTIDDVLKIQAEARMVVAPPAQQFILDDATPEAVAETIVECGGRAAQMSSEGTIVDLMGGQYAERGKGANVGVWLQGWGGEPLRQKRVGRGWITHPSGTLTMCVMPQPGLVRRLGENAELGERGITARFLYSMPPTNFGGRDYNKLLRPAGQEVRDTYETRLLEIANRFSRSSAPIVLRTSHDGTMRWIGWLNETEARLRPGGDLEGKGAWLAKLRAQVLRLAALLHVADGAGQADELGPVELERAFVLADYFIAHYVAMHEVWTAGARPAVQRARRVIEWVVREGVSEFTASELQRKLRRVFDVIGDTVEPLTWLVEAGWLRAESGIPVRVGQPGKPSPRFFVHPRTAECANGAKADGSSGGNGARPVDEGADLRAIRAFAQTPHPVQGESSAHVPISPFSDLSIYLHQYEDPSHSNGGLREGANGANPADEAPATDTPPPIVANDPDATPPGEVPRAW